MLVLVNGSPPPHRRFVDQSFAKNFGLYCERIGALHVVTSDPKSAGAVMSVLENIVRPMYSNPPAHGARIVAHVLNSAELTEVSDAFGFL
jgi:aspartate/tyrosine/aromatic aminotransferase